MDLKLKIRSGFGHIDGKLSAIRKLTKGSRAFIVTIPKLWVELYCTPREDGTYWVGFEQDGDTITIRAYKGDRDDRHKGN